MGQDCYVFILEKLRYNGGLVRSSIIKKLVNLKSILLPLVLKIRLVLFQHFIRVLGRVNTPQPG